MKLKLKFIVLCFLCIGMGACSKKDSVENTENGNGQGALPMERPFGTPLGQVIIKTIGPEGGTLVSEDGLVKIVVPAGTITKPVDFSIQAITNTLEGSPGIAYRLLPEDVTFQKPISITFDFEDADIEPGDSDLLFMVYQDKKGHHYLASDTELDKDAKKLTVKTTHFSDWMLVLLFELEVSKEEVSVEETSNLRLMWHLGALLGPLTKDQPIGELTEYNGQISALEWSIGYGKGTIKANGANCIYTAPRQVPAENPTQVSVSVPLSLYKSKRKEIVMMSTPIIVNPNDYMIVKIDGKQLVNKPPQNGESFVMIYSNNFTLNAQLENDYGIALVIPSAQGVGNYPYGHDYNKAYIDLGTDEAELNSWTTSKSNCFECGEVHSEGSVKITRYGDGYVEGEFKADVWKIGSYNPPKKELEGKFRARLITNP